ncbi:hypothetical protein EZS27_022238, partial [termite gut metagenome]
MEKLKLFLFLLLSLIISNTADAQLKQAVLNIINADTTAEVGIDPVAVDSDKTAEMEKALEEARVNEMNLRLEMEVLRTQMHDLDSLEKDKQRQRIDSLRKITAKIPVVV